MASKRTATAAKPGASKADFVRERGHLSPREIVEDANAHGLKFDPSYVYKVRGYDKATASKKAPASKKTPSSKPAVTTPAAPASTSKATAPNGTHSSSGAKVEGLLRAVAAELGLGRAIDILQGERARVRAVIGG